MRRWGCRKLRSPCRRPRKMQNKILCLIRWRSQRCRCRRQAGSLLLPGRSEGRSRRWWNRRSRWRARRNLNPYINSCKQEGVEIWWKGSQIRTKRPYSLNLLSSAWYRHRIYFLFLTQSIQLRLSKSLSFHSCHHQKALTDNSELNTKLYIRIGRKRCTRRHYWNSNVDVQSVIS